MSLAGHAVRRAGCQPLLRVSTSQYSKCRFPGSILRDSDFGRIRLGSVCVCVCVKHIVKFVERKHRAKCTLLPV